MIDMSGVSSSNDKEFDPDQEMIRQAIAAAQSQPAASVTGAASPTNDRPDPPTLGERIAGKQNAAPPQPAAPQPTRVVVKPQQKAIPPGTTGVLLPTDRDGKTRPSFGQQIGGEKSTPIPPSVASVVPQSAPPAALTAGLDRKPVPAAPIGSNNPNLTTALAEQQKYATPLDRNATDASGKKIYKMGLGQRLLGIAANFASGLAGGRVIGDDSSDGADRRRGGGPVVYVGPGATNRRYAIDDATRQSNLEKANLNVAGQEKLDSSNLNLEKAAQRQAYEATLGESRKETADARAATAAAQQETADTRDKLADLQKPKPDSQSRAADADKYGLKGDARRDYILTGKLPKDMMGSQRQPTDLETWMQAFQRDNKRQPTADEIAQRKAKTRGSPEEFANVEAKKQQALSAAESGYRKAVSQALTDDDKKDALDDLNETKNRAQSAYEQEIRSLGGNVGTATSPTTTATSPNTSASGKTPPKPTAPPPAGKVWVYEKKTGKRGLIPASQLSTATKGAAAQYGTW